MQTKKTDTFQGQSRSNGPRGCRAAGWTRPLQIEALEGRLLLSTVRLDAPSAATGDVADFDFSPDGRFAVYVADAVDDHQFDLYSVELASGQVQQLNASAGSSVTDFQISTDSRRVVYLSQNFEDIYELYSVALVGGPATRLDTALNDEGNFASIPSGDHFAISPDSSRVAYISDQVTDEVFELFSVPITGGARTRLSEALDNDGHVWEFQISADSQHVVYRANQDRDDAIELYSVPLAGGESVKLNSPLLRYHRVEEFEISPDGRWVVYLADQLVRRRFELFSVPISAGASTRLNGELRSNNVGSFQISGDSVRVVYLAEQDSDSKELYSVLIAGGEPTKLNGPIGQYEDVLGYRVSPDGSWVVYTAHHGQPRQQLFRVAITGGEFTNFSNSELHAFSDVQFSPDGVYAIFQVGSSLYSAPLEGGEKSNLSTLATGEMVAAKQGLFRVTPDGSRVVYVALVHAGDGYYFGGIFSAPIAGGSVIQLNAPLVRDGQVSRFVVTTDGNRVAYLADQEVVGVSELYLVDTVGGAVDKLSRPIMAVGDSVSSALFSPDGKHAVYRANQDDDRHFELSSVATATGVITKLVTGSVDADFQISPDGQQVVYLTYTLHSVPLTGGESTKLAEANFWQIYQFQISPDGSRVVFRASPIDRPADIELYSVPITGGPLTRLNGPFGRSGGQVSRFEITPDGRHVVYQADQESRHLELYIVPISGGGFTKLNGPLRDDLVDFQIAPDSKWVVYRTEDFSIDDLYSVSITGTGLTRLNKRPLPAASKPIDETDSPGIRPLRGGVDGVLAYKISPDSRYVVYTADEEVDWREEVYSVPISGGPSTKLNDFQIRGLPWFDISPDGNWVVFGDYFWRTPEILSDLHSVPITGGDVVQLKDPLLRQLRTDLQFSSDRDLLIYRSEGQIYSVPLAGGASILLNSELVAGGQVEGDFAIAPGGNTVLYRADRDSDNVFELYRAPINGGGGGWKLNGPLVAGGDVNQFEISADGSRVLYLADQDINQQMGLYLAQLPPFQDLRVTSFVPNGSGFVVEFNDELNPDLLDLYAPGPTDVVLEGAVAGPVAGSFVVDPSLRSGRFVKSGGPLSSDIYTLRLSGGGEGFQSSVGAWLDGNGDSFVGDDFSTSFIHPVYARAVKVPDFVSGPGEEVQLPGEANKGIPITITDGKGVRNAVIQVGYHPALLSMTGATIGPSMPTGSTLTFETTAAGTASITLNSPVDLPPGEQVLVHLQATVPVDDREEIYGHQQVVELRVASLADVDGQPLSAIADHGVHVAALFGDVSGNGRVNPVDASRVARVVAGLDAGFAATPLLDPRITGDISGNGVMNAVDAVRLLWLPLGSPPTFANARVTLSVDKESISEIGYLELDTTVAAELSVTGEEDLYTFSLAADSHLYFDALTSDSTVDWTLTGPAGLAVDGRLLASETFDQSAAVLDLRAGHYELTIDGRGDATGSYAFRMLNLETAERFVPGTPVAGELNPATEADLYRFTASAGDRLFFDSQTDRADVRWQLFDPLGDVIFSSQFSEDQERLTIAHAGTHTLAIDGRQGTAGTAPYRFNVQPEGGSTTRVTPSEDVVSGSIELAGEQDEFQIELAVDSRLYFSSLTDNRSLTWTLSGPGGVLVDRRSLTASDPTPVLDLAVGDYSLVIDGLGDVTAPYQFRLVELRAATPIVPGTQVSGEFTPANETDFYRFTASAGDHLNFDAQAGPSDAIWRLIDPHSDVLFSRPFTDDHVALTLDWSGEYTLLIEGDDGAAEQTAYRFAVHPADLSTTVVSTSGEIVSGSISVPHERDFFEFRVESRTALFLDSLTNNASLAWSFHGPSGSVIRRPFTKTDGLDQAGAVYNLRAGPYTLIVEGFGDATGAYDFRLLDLQHGETLEDGLPVSGTLSPRATDVYHFEVTAGDAVSFQAEPKSAPATWRLVDPRNGVSLLADFASTNRIMNFGAQAGTWTVLVEAPVTEAMPIDYTFTATVLRNTPPLPATGQDLPIGATISGTISEASQRDTYKFSLASHAQLYFDSLADNNRFRWSLRQPGYEARVRSFSDSLLRDLAPGDHILTVHSIGGGTGDYAFRLLDPNAATTIVPGEIVTGSFDPGSETDLYAFSARAGEKFFLDAKTGNAIASWRLRDPFGSSVSTHQFTRDHDTQTLAHSGEYLLLIKGLAVDGPATYQFNVQRVQDDLAVLKVNETVSGAIDETGEMDLYHFELEAPARLYFDALTTSHERLWTLTGPGTEVSERSFAASDSFATEEPVLDLRSGEYTLTVDSPGDSVGDYRFRLLDVSAADHIVPGISTFGELLPADETDIYRFDALAGDQFYFDMQAGDPAALWRVVDPYNNVVFSLPANTDQETLALQHSGTYTVLLEGSPLATGVTPYAFNIQPVVDDPAALTLGTTIGSAIDSPGDQDTFLLTLDERSQVYFDALSGVTGLGWSLVGPGGTVVDHRAFIGSNSVDRRTPVFTLHAGSYELMVDADGDTVGSYAFRLLDVAAAMPFEPGMQISGQLTSSGEADLYRFAAQEGDRFYFDALSEVVEANWSVIDPLDRVIAAARFGSDFDTLTLSAPGNYGVLIEQTSGTADTTPYRFVVEPVRDAFIPLNLDATVAQTIRGPGEQHHYEFELESDDRLHFDSLTNHGSFNWTLKGPAGTEVSRRPFTRSDSIHSDQPILDLVPGAYTLTVDAEGDAIGSYAFELTSFRSATPLTIGTSTEGRLDPANESDFYQFEAAAGDQFSWIATAGVGAADWTLIDPFNNILFSDVFQTVSESVTVEQAGLYLLLVSGHVDATEAADYRFEVQHLGNDPPDPLVGEPLPAGLVRGNLAVPGEEDHYRFTVAHDTRMIFDVRSAASASDFNWSLLGPAGELVAERSFAASDSFDQLDPVVELATGDYQLTVRAANGAIGAYDFGLLDLASAVPLRPGKTVAGTLAPASATQLYQFEGRAGDQLFFDVRAGLHNTAWKLVDPYSNVLFASQFRADRDTLTLSQAGTYTVLIEGRHDAVGEAHFIFNVQPVREEGSVATLTASLSRAVGLPVTVQIALAGSAFHNEDFVASSAEIVIPAGSRTGSLTLTALQDNVRESPETIIAEIVAVENAVEEDVQQRTVMVTDERVARRRAARLPRTLPVVRGGQRAATDRGKETPETRPIVTTSARLTVRADAQRELPGANAGQSPATAFDQRAPSENVVAVDTLMSHLDDPLRPDFLNMAKSSLDLDFAR